MADDLGSTQPAMRGATVEAHYDYLPYGTPRTPSAEEAAGEQVNAAAFGV